AVAIGGLFARDAASAFVVGAGVIAGVVGWLLPLPVHRIWIYALLLLALVGLRRRALVACSKEALSDWRAAVDASPRIAAAAMLALGLASAGAWLPTMQYDDLAYHLGLPWQLQLHGRYDLDASMQVWALAPWAGDVLHGIAQVLARAEARGPLGAAWLIVSAALVARIAGRLGAPVGLRWVAMALLATLPPVAALVGGMQTELPAMAAMLALLALATRVEPRGLLAVGVLTGLLGGLKAMHPLAAIGLIAIAASRNARGRRAATWLAACALAIAIAASSYASAWRICGNPVLPLFNDVFASPCFAAAAFDDARWQQVSGLPLPWSMTFLTGRHLEAFDGGLGLLLVALAGAAVAALFDRRTRWQALAGLLAIALPMTVIAYARYVVPGIVVLLPVAAATVARLYTHRTALAMLAALCVLDLAFQANAHWMLHTGAIKRSVGALGRDAPLFERYVPERAVIGAIRRQWPEARVLDLGGAAHAELAGRGLTTTWYAPALQADATVADADSTGAAWARLLRARRVDVVLLRKEHATPARRAGLVRAGAHLAMTVGPVECWRLARDGSG
ncbi:MAG TPA: hypothetical protein VFE72_05825, partial [Lysobacter sp.]|nr:hypothetical protein [Lysobacter sp.]